MRLELLVEKISRNKSGPALVFAMLLTLPTEREEALL